MSPRSRPVSRHFRWLYRHPGAEIKGALRVVMTYANRSEIYRYWVESIPSDFGAAFRFEKIEPDGSTGETYEACADGERGHCDCKGHERWGHCKHVDAARAIAAREKVN